MRYVAAGVAVASIIGLATAYAILIEYSTLVSDDAWGYA
jgi:hypothetical protein